MAVASAVCTWQLQRERKLEQARLVERQHAEIQYQKIREGLKANAVSANSPVKSLLSLAGPQSQRVLGEFTVYYFEWIPQYHGLEIVAKGGELILATEASCTFVTIHFDAMTADEKERYQELREEELEQELGPRSQE